MKKSGRRTCCRGMLDLLILRALRHGPLNGWDVMQRIRLSLVLSIAIASFPASAASQTYSYNDYDSTPGYMGWTYWDSLGQQMVWNANTSRWTCLNPVDEWCYWSKLG